MRKFTPIAALVALAVVLAACGGDADNGSDDNGTATDNGSAAGDGEQITLNLWTFGNFGYDELIEEYQDDNPNIPSRP
jgi:cellobiose transport system substrate-binding protein